MKLLSRLLYVLAPLLLLTNTSLADVDIGLNFRCTAAYVTDGANETYVLDDNGGCATDYAYPIVQGGFTFGYTDQDSNNDIARNRDNTIDRRLAGQHNTSNNGTSVLTFRIDGLTAGTATIHLGYGYKFDVSNNYLQILDSNGTTSLLTIAKSLSSDQYGDATGTAYSTANWPASETGVDVTVSGDHIFLKIGAQTSQTGYTNFSHIRIVQAGGTTTTTVTTSTTTTTGGGSTTTTVSTSTTTTVPSCAYGGANCMTTDKDFDGYATASDCDDTDKLIYPGVYTSKGLAAGHYRLCQANGTYGTDTDSAVTPLCEKTGAGSCYYISCASGNDSTGDGTYSNPWASGAKVGFGGTGVTPVAGSVVYFKDGGTCATTYTAGVDGNQFLSLRSGGTAGFPIAVKRYPGATVKFDPTSDAGFYFLADYIKVEDIEFTGGFTNQFYAYGNHQDYSRLHCYSNAQGVAGNNNGCVKAVTVQDVRVHHSRFYDNYDQNGTTENVSNVIFFECKGCRFDHNDSGYSQGYNSGSAIAGNCFKSKHGVLSSQAGDLEIDHNILWNCRNGIVVGRPNVYAHNNKIIGSQRCFKWQDTGGSTPFGASNVNFLNNTCKDGNGVELSDFQNTDEATGQFNIRKNVITGTHGTYAADDAWVRINHYGPDAGTGGYSDMVNAFGPKFFFEDNIYNNTPGALRFSVYGNNGSSTFGSVVNFSNFKLTYNFDTTSFEEAVTFGSYDQASSTNSSGKGFDVEDGSTPTTTTSSTTSTTTLASTTTTTVASTTTTTLASTTFPRRRYRPGRTGSFFPFMRIH